MTDCPRIGRLIGGCRFEARYDEPVFQPMRTFFWTETRGEVAQPTRTYIHDICVKCGKVVERGREGK